jgi:hypothetical protein
VFQASGAGPSVSSPLNSLRGGKKLLIHSLKDGLLGCPLQALQALVPEGYLQGNVGKTTLDWFADILVHHQIAVSSPSDLFSTSFFLFFFKPFPFTLCLSMLSS